MEHVLELVLAFVLGLLVQHWTKALPLLGKLAPSLLEKILAWWYFRNGYITDYLGYRFVWVDKTGTLAITSIGDDDTTVSAVYGGKKTVAGMAMARCKTKGCRFLRDTNPKSWRRFMGPLRSGVAGRLRTVTAALREAANLGSSQKVEVGYGMLSTIDENGDSTHRVLSMAAIQLARLKQDYEAGKITVPVGLERVMEDALEMAALWQEQSDPAKLQVLGKLSAPVEALPSHAADTVTDFPTPEWYQCIG